MPEPSLYLASPCYGGLARAAFMRALLALQTACAARGVGLRTELGGGEALVSRGRAGMMARFLASDATHLLFVDSDLSFEPEDVFRLLRADREVVGAAGRPEAGSASQALQPAPWVAASFLMIGRPAAQRISEAYPDLRAKLGDVRGSRAAEAVMVFDPLIEPGTGRYLVDGQAFCHRWRSLGGEVWADGRVRATRSRDLVDTGEPREPP